MRILPLLLIACLCFSQELLLNTYDKTGYLFTDGRIETIFTFEADIHMTLKDYITDYYIPPSISVEYIPLPKQDFLISNRGKTIGTMGTDIVIPKSLYEKLVELFKSGAQILVTLDRYPIEIYSDHILVLEYDSEKIKEFLPHFVNYELSKITKPGRYSLELPSLEIEWVVTSYPGFGGAIIPIFKSEFAEIQWTIDDVHRKDICVVYPVGEHFINVHIDGKAYGFETTVLSHKIFSTQETFEVGSPMNGDIISLSGLHGESLTIPGTFLFLQLRPEQVRVIKATVIDSTCPVLEVNVFQKVPGIFELVTSVSDMTACTVRIFLDGKELAFTKGVLSLAGKNHTLVAIAEDTFGNKSYAIRQISDSLELSKSMVFVEQQEQRFDVQGFGFVSPYIKWWLAKDVSVRMIKNGYGYTVETH